jgi:hypothetical protein
MRSTTWVADDFGIEDLPDMSARDLGRCLWLW